MLLCAAFTLNYALYYSAKQKVRLDKMHSGSVSDSDMQIDESEVVPGGVDSSLKPDKKREASSPLQAQFAQPEKKNKPHIEDDAESDTESRNIVHTLNPILELDDANTPGDTSTVHILSRPMNPADIVEIASELKALMLPEIKGMIESSIPGIKLSVIEAVKESYQSLSDEVKSLREENEHLKILNGELEKKVSDVVDANETLEQYGRRNSVRISGVPVRQNEVTDEIVLDIAQALGVAMDVSEIDRSHRVGKPTNRNRDILVKFVSYRSRQKLYSRRKDLRDNDATMGTFINEDLTRCRSKILYEARLSAKGENAIFKAAYSSDGKIFAIDKTDNRHMIQSVDAYRPNFKAIG